MMNIKKQFQECLQAIGKDAEERQGIPICIKDEWHTIATSIVCEKCNAHLFAIGQGTQAYWCDPCQELSMIEVSIEPTDDIYAIRIGVGKPRRVDEIKIGAANRPF